MNRGWYASNYLSPAQQRLLGGWRDIVDDIKALCRDLAALPDACRCGSGGGHLSATCTCCGHLAIERVPHCHDCESQLARLVPAIDRLGNDTFRFFPLVKELLQRDTPPALAEEARTIEWRIAQVIRTFESLTVAADQFRADCRVSHLQTLKARASSLSHDCDALNRAI